MFGDWATLDVASKALGVTYVKLYKWVKAHPNVETKRAGRTILVRLASLEGLDKKK
jgi:hypothetical protein